MGSFDEAHRMLRLALLTTLVACSLAAEFSTTASFTVKVGKTKKTASCDITISYDGAVVSQADSSASCSVAWAKKSALNFAKTLSSTRLRFGAHKKITSSGGRVHSKVLLMKPPQQGTRSVHSAVLSSPMRLEILRASLGR